MHPRNTVVMEYSRCRPSWAYIAECYRKNMALLVARMMQKRCLPCTELTTLLRGETAQCCWDHRDTDAQDVAPGAYVARLNGLARPETVSLVIR